VIDMRGNTVYLEAPGRTQELLNIKWTLRSAGYRIGSTWHEGEASMSMTSKDHWNAMSVEQLKTCESLVVICGKGEGPTPELAMIAGFALARGLGVIWVGPQVRSLTAFRAVQEFDTSDAFLKQILEQMYSQSTLADGRLAA
jgi:hypothetical protein